MCFNPRARAGRDSSVPCWRSPVQCFNPRARAGRDDFDTQVFEAQLGVSIHAPVRGATSQRLQLNRCYRSFNPRARAGRDTRCPASGSAFRGFNPRARAGRDEAIQQLQESRSCFNPRARAGRDVLPWAICKCPSCFNPRARAGRDVSGKPRRGEREVSIHAPVRGATRARIPRLVATVFQSTRPCGARPPSYNLLISMKKTFYFSETCLL